MTKRYSNTLRSRILSKIYGMPGVIVLRSDVSDLSDARQVSRGLKALIEDGQLVRLGSGVYAKARQSTHLGRPVIRSGFINACVEALKRLHVNWEPSQAMKDYNAGKMQQVPTQFEIRLKSRFRRKLSYGNRVLRIEGMQNAK